jgi:succinyl-CoA synthetase beta subunit
MIGSNLITTQSGAEGKPCHKVFVGERLYFRRETYFAILFDRELGGPVMVGSPSGGMNIEEVANKTPELIHKVCV